ncbi:MAG: hypothetical protein KC449_31080, partial [Anaerolineales bacterium]|nr:hypothetical protein [Anaerolineales bacterium]
MKSKKWVWSVGVWGAALFLLWLVVRSVPLEAVVKMLAGLRGWHLVVLVALNGWVLLALNGRW